MYISLSAFFTNSMQVLEDALEKSKQAYGEKHPTTARIYHTAATLYEVLKPPDMAKARDYYKKGYEIKRSLFGEDHKKTKDAKGIFDEVDQIVKKESRKK